MMRKAFYAIIATVLVLAVYMMLKPKVIMVDTEIIRRTDFEETLSVDGKIRSQERKTVYAFISGNLSSLNVKFGDVVSQGQALVSIDGDRRVPVKSPISGVITKVYRDSAGPINRGEPIFEVSSVDKLEIIAEVLTPEAVKLNLGMGARVINWGGSGELIAKIAHISKAGIVKTSALGVEEERTEVRLHFEQIPKALIEKFGDNFHVDLEFVLSKESSVLTVPLGALFKVKDQWAVFYIDQSGKAKTQEVSIAKRNDQRALVTSGLSEGMNVILYPSDKINEGSKVSSSSIK